jgi:hypothetical protein
MKITEFTICLHCGCNRDITNKQMEALKPLEEKYKVIWNNRIDRYPKMYPSYSQLINHSIATSPTEWVILINDRTHPTVQEVEKMLYLLENGMSCVFLYNVGFMGFAKELIRKIGWWDERFLQGGWEDRDWVWRLYMADLALYESQESTYDNTWKSPLNVPGCNLSTPYWLKKYIENDQYFVKHISEEIYQHWDLFIGDERLDISNTWLKWNNSILGINYDRPDSGPPASRMLSGKQIITAY